MTDSRFSKISREQEIALVSREMFDNVWCLEYQDPKLRFEMNGEPVKLSDLILIKHCFT